jgi:peptide/nickel transport system ATP-binding protein
VTVDTSEEPILSVRNLEVDYRTKTGTVRAVDGVSLELRRGDVLALVGESGSGKSTTVSAMLGILPPTAQIRAERVEFNGVDLVGLSAQGWRRIRGRQIGFVPQDPGIALNPTLTVGYQIAEALSVHRIGDAVSRKARTLDLLRSVGIDDPERRTKQYPHQLSGGMRQRVLIAIALACEPEVVIADEPTSALDVTVQKAVLDQLELLVSNSGAALVLITHDLGVAAERATHMAVMRAGRIVEQGPAERVVKAPSNPYTAQLTAAAPSMSSERLRPTANVRHALRVDHASGPVRSTVVAMNDVVKTFGTRGRAFTAVDGVSLEIRSGETLAIVGESGSGKSTIARLLMGLEQPTAGEVTIDGVGSTGSLDRRGRRALARKVQLVYQSPYASLDPRYTVAQIIDEPLRAFDLLPRSARARRVAQLLEQVALAPELLDRRPRELSGGQSQRVAIARALASEPDLIVLDEAVSALDVSVQAQILQLLVNLQAEFGLTYVFISHDLAVVRQVSDRVVVMRTGRIVERGTVDAIFDNPKEQYTRELLDAIPHPLEDDEARASVRRAAVARIRMLKGPTGP